MNHTSARSAASLGAGLAGLAAAWILGGVVVLGATQVRRHQAHPA